MAQRASSLTSAPVRTLVTQIGVINRIRWQVAATWRDQRENKNNAPAADPAPDAADSDRRLDHADAEHGVAAVARHLPAAADARHPHLGVRFHAGAGRTKPSLGIFAAARRRYDGALRLSPDHAGRLAVLHRGSGAAG